MTLDLFLTQNTLANTLADTLLGAFTFFSEEIEEPTEELGDDFLADDDDDFGADSDDTHTTKKYNPLASEDDPDSFDLYDDEEEGDEAEGAFGFHTTDGEGEYE